VTLRCNLAEVRPKVERIRKFLVEVGRSEKAALECELALVEACTNAIQHASVPGKSKGVAIFATIEDSKCEFRVIDHTAGFKWPQNPALPDAQSEHGRGVFLIQSLMDSSEYILGDEENVLILRKHL